MKPSTAKRKGAATETMFVNYLRRHGVPHAERRHLSGSADQGDIGGWPYVCVEVKSGAKLNPLKWLRELADETRHAKALTGAVAVRPKGRPDVEDWYVMMPVDGWMALMRDAGYIEQGN